MRLVPRSLFGRLLVTAGLTLVVALGFAALSIGHVLERFVMHGLDERLDAQIAVVSRAVTPDGGIDRARLVDVPPFDEPGSGWAWEVRAPGGAARSASLEGASIDIPSFPGPGPIERLRHDDRELRPFDVGDGSDGIHGRVATLPSTRGEVTILAVGPRAVVERPLGAAMVPLLVSLLLLGSGLAAAILVQLRFGLRPLAVLQAMVSDVRNGRRAHIEAREPTELVPLIDEINALIDTNQAALTQARGHVANLAHGLKTPLAALRIDVAEAGRDPDGRLAAQIERIDRHIRHHLGRARAASPAGAARLATPLGPRVADIVAALAHIHADRGVAAAVDVPDDIAVRCDPQDIDEMLGNLLDNGWRWARSRVSVSAERDGGMIRIVVADDGPGLSADQIRIAIEPGARLDERGDGHGFGLPITRELAELYGGRLTLENADSGGLRAVVTLPVAQTSG